MRYTQIFLILVLALSTISLSSQASVFVWKDHVSGTSFTFPDHWKLVHTQKADVIAEVVAPHQNEFVSCRMRMRDDKRFVIFPHSYDANIQRRFVSTDFWKDYVSEFDGTAIHRIRDDAGLSEGFASRADFTFITDRGPRVLKRGFAHASLYDGHLYAFECSAEYDAYEKWYPVFQSILKSVSFGQRHPMQKYGYYENFYGDPKIQIHNKRPIDLYTY